MTFFPPARIFPVMSTTFRNILADTSAFARGANDFFSTPPGLPRHSGTEFLGGVFTVAATTLAFGTFLVTETGNAILSEIKRLRRLREPRPESPSLRGTPSAAEIASDWAEKPRTLAIRLRLGSRLADLGPTLDSGTRYDVAGTGAKRIAARGPGLKGWLAGHRIEANYSTLMKYKLLAVRLRNLLELDERLPLEWLLPGGTPDSAIPADLQNPYAAARRRLQGLLRTHRNFSRLKKHVETALGIPRLLTVRRHARRSGQPVQDCRVPAKRKALRCSPMVLGDRSVLFEDNLLEATRREVLLFLQTPDLPPRLDKLRRRAIGWFREKAAGVT